MHAFERQDGPRNAVVAIRFVMVSYLIAFGMKICALVSAYRILKAQDFLDGKAARPFGMLIVFSLLFYAFVAVVIVKLNDRSNFARGTFAVLLMMNLMVSGIQWTLGKAPLAWSDVLISATILSMQLWAAGLLYSKECEGWFE